MRILTVSNCTPLRLGLVQHRLLSIQPNVDISRDPITAKTAENNDLAQDRTPQKLSLRQ